MRKIFASLMRNIVKYRILLAILIASPVLAQSAPPPTPLTQPITQQPMQTPADQLRLGRGSLLRASMMSNAQPQVGSVSFFAVTPPEPRVLKKHDLVTIIVREESNSSSEGTNDLSKEANITAKLNEYFKFDPKEFTITSAIPTAPPGVDFNAKREIKGDASVDRKDVITLRITASVLDVKPNGTVVLTASKKIKIDDEEQYIIIAGICRAEDVSADNTILSTQLAELEMSKQHTGAVRDTTRRGWLTKLLDAVAPF